MALELVPGRSSSIIFSKGICRLDSAAIFTFPLTVFDELKIKWPTAFGIFLYDPDIELCVIRVTPEQTQGSKVFKSKRDTTAISASAFVTYAKYKTEKPFWIKYQVNNNEIHINMKSRSSVRDL